MANQFTDTDINKIVQDKSNLPQWPAMVHKFDAAKGTFSHKRVETARERDQWIAAGWFKTPLEAESAATDGKPYRTENDPTLPDDTTETVVEPESADAPNATRGRRR
jgi:hypothetical protein